jgi:glyoxylase-like metal-dependent hydrolase (beta-lactamase superfamily II)
MVRSSDLTIDVEHHGLQGVIACRLLDCEGSLALIDPGPSITLDGLRQQLRTHGVAIHDISAILLTHIHLDHAGGTGALIKENPNIRVFVHSKGAPHLVDPSRLLESAARVYNGDYESLWGSMTPLCTENLNVIYGGEYITLGKRELEVLYTPGHAVHHVSYYDPASATIYAGDTAGVRLCDSVVLPATPPPDIDLEQHEISLNEIEARSPAQLFLTHFGMSKDIRWHFAELRKRLASWALLVKESLSNVADDETRAREFSSVATAEFGVGISAIDVARYTVYCNPKLSWYGLARYWRKKSIGEQSH